MAAVACVNFSRVTVSHLPSGVSGFHHPMSWTAARSCSDEAVCQGHRTAQDYKISPCWLIDSCRAFISGRFISGTWGSEFGKLKRVNEGQITSKGQVSLVCFQSVWSPPAEQHTSQASTVPGPCYCCDRSADTCCGHCPRPDYFTPVTRVLACSCSTDGDAFGVSNTARVPAVIFSLMAIIRAAARMLWTIFVFMPA